MTFHRAIDVVCNNNNNINNNNNNDSVNKAISILYNIGVDRILSSGGKDVVVSLNKNGDCVGLSQLVKMQKIIKKCYLKQKQINYNNHNNSINNDSSNNNNNNSNSNNKGRKAMKKAVRDVTRGFARFSHTIT